MTKPLAESLPGLVKADPAAFPAAPADGHALAIAHRTEHQAHTCLCCDRPARVAYIAATPQGPRWLDLCPDDAYGVRKANESERDWWDASPGPDACCLYHGGDTEPCVATSGTAEGLVPTVHPDQPTRKRWAHVQCIVRNHAEQTYDLMQLGALLHLYPELQSDD